MMPGSAIGLRNSPCITAPATPRAAPTISARVMRDSLIDSTMARSASVASRIRIPICSSRMPAVWESGMAYGPTAAAVTISAAATAASSAPPPTSRATTGDRGPLGERIASFPRTRAPSPPCVRGSPPKRTCPAGIRDKARPEALPERRAATQPCPAGLLAPGSSPVPRLPIPVRGDSGIKRAAHRSQWRHRSGFSPLSLFGLRFRRHRARSAFRDCSRLSLVAPRAGCQTGVRRPSSAAWCACRSPRSCAGQAAWRVRARDGAAATRRPAPA